MGGDGAPPLRLAVIPRAKERHRMDEVRNKPLHTCGAHLQLAEAGHRHLEGLGTSRHPSPERIASIASW